LKETGVAVCSKCGKSKKVTEFWKKDGERIDICKDCLTMYADNRKPDTFRWILKMFDVPYIERKWIEMANKAYLANPATFGPKTVLGKYIRTMGMGQYRKYGYEDSEMLNNQELYELQRRQAAQKRNYDAEREKELEKKFKAGEISEAEYKTLSHKDIIQQTKEQIDEVVESVDGEVYRFKDKLDVADKPDDEGTSSSLGDEKPQEEKTEKEPKKEKEKALDIGSKHAANSQLDIAAITGGGNVPTDQFIPDAAAINEQDIQNDLTPDDIKYLSLKWGLLYKPSEWVKMEELYQKYAADYELSTDREQVLKTICKTDLKMNQAIDVGDTKTFKDLQAANDQLRKSAKFTDSQKQEEKKRDLDSIGELVAFVENKGGIIPMKDDPIHVPQDKIDFIINDMKNYTDNLVKNELGLGNLIESYIKKLEENKAMTADDILKQGIKSDDDDIVTPEEARDFQEFKIAEREEEAKRLAEEYGA